MMHDARRLECLNEPMQKLQETLTPVERLARLTPEGLRAALAPEERLVGLAPEEQMLALSDEVLRGFSEDCARSLPAHVQEVIRATGQRASHRMGP